MAVYHQMGYDSINLVFEEHLGGFSGAILSPVNCDFNKSKEFIENTSEHFNKFENILDPQLYYPKSNRGVLNTWPYFPNDVDTADISSHSWWSELLESLSENVLDLGVSTVCSPIIHPNSFSQNFYEFTNQLAINLKELLSSESVRVMKTVFVSLSELSSREYVMRISSILSRDSVDGIYLIFYGNRIPRRELLNFEELKGAMLLIHLLSLNQIQVLVGYSSSDIILWKAAGASSCATGKFFNLRRFSPSRWDADDGGGGGQLPYLFEEKLLSFLREPDVVRLEKMNFLSQTTMNNPYFIDIQPKIHSDSPWLALSWRFFLYWYMDFESRIDNSAIDITDFLRIVDKNWGVIDEKDILFDERQNNGDWIRQWLRAVIEFNQNP